MTYLVHTTLPNQNTVELEAETFAVVDGALILLDATNKRIAAFPPSIWIAITKKP